jgi:GH35 family endo-1,4-beta-xylanase
VSGATPWYNDPRFGLANVLPDGAAVPGQARSATVGWMTRARASGAGGNRWELRWDRIEPAPGRYDWSEVDAVVAANEAAGLPLLAILIGTPAWAADGRASSVPSGLDAPPIMPDGTAGERNVWGRFVHAVAKRYRGRIAAYEVWNEPNRPDFWGGTPEQYYRLLSAGMAAIRHADPNARVVLGGLDGYRNL